MLGFGGHLGIRYVWNDAIAAVSSQVHREIKIRISPIGFSILNDICTDIVFRVLEVAMQLLCRLPRSSGAADALTVENNDEESENEDEDEDEDENLATHCFEMHAGAPSVTGDLDSSQHIIFFGHPPTEDDEDGNDFDWKPLEKPVMCLCSRDIHAAMLSLFPEQLAKHADTEGTRAVSKFSCNDAVGSLRVKAGLQFHPEHVALIANRLTGDCPMSDGAAVYLCAVVEYMIAEVLEMSGNVAKDQHSSLIDGRCISLGIRSDEELDRFFQSNFIRGGGIKPFIHKPFLQTRDSDEGEDEGENVDKGENEDEGKDEDDGDEDEDVPSDFEKMLITKAESTDPSLCFIDPRTGRHCRVGSTKAGSPVLEPVPLMDSLSAESEQQRARLARGALSPAELSLMKLEGRCRIEDTAEDGWANPSLETIYKRNLAEIRRLQNNSSGLIFAPIPFSWFMVDPRGQYVLPP
jgi:histone H2A